ncbi:MAG: hypothetical protein LAQ69_30490 [Acidobacteriia bacterium]|nr:hypothetical protein [Terriglobia bacterium]
MRRHAIPRPRHRTLCGFVPGLRRHQKKIAMYNSVGPPITIGRFLLFLGR